jgi:hypothetical protein
MKAARLLRHPAAILVLITAEAGLACLTGWVREPVVEALATAAFAVIAAGIALLVRTMKPRRPAGAHVAHGRSGKQRLLRRQRP